LLFIIYGDYNFEEFSKDFVYEYKDIKTMNFFAIINKIFKLSSVKLKGTRT
jgi:hypothetical protein